ncbi:MAG TPA: UDP-N-acetylmuramoyl-tripeptide--D-alanyl-D-alanine ligase [Ktedonobacterales bacterium]|jgi:UDP-N-acetylmuramoyl-tripeptide--D-alanyl-D-alanine ligase|nr:UDP-N-acetylmuramoyl-tripeptide--D-alanyl-D-alanine ligase [Ktedonobacterales bacterium]
MFSSEELLDATAGVVVGGALPTVFPGAAIDSRQVRPGELFVAIRGETTDGHRYIGAAVEHGAAAILCAQPDSEALERGVPQVIVADPLAALQEVAKQRLARQPETRVIAIAGSNGKTSVKEATAALLERLAPTLRTTGNLNTETGVPVSLLRLLPEHRYAVIEMGAQRVGEVAALCRIAPPEIAVVTVVGPEHLEFFGGMAQVIQAEGEIVDALAPDGLAILNADDADVRGMASRTHARILTYGRAEGADVRAVDVKGDTLTGLSFTLIHEGQQSPVHLQLPGAHAVSTAAAASGVALSCGMPLEEIAVALGELHPAKRRGEVKLGVNGCVVIDDSYNSNRQSALAALETLRGAQIPAGARRWFVFGDMLELGDYSPAEHAAVGAALAQSGIERAVLVGQDTRYTYEAALAAGLEPARIIYFPAPLNDREELARAKEKAVALLCAQLTAGDLALVKGSLGVGMDTVVAALTGAEVADAGH